MAQLLVTHVDEKHWYSPIANIKKYTEPDFEAKLFRYANDIFENYFVLKFKYPLECEELPGLRLEPDLLLISKSFKKWVILEVELCKTPSKHTRDQITCFSNPKYDIEALLKFILNQNSALEIHEDELRKMFSDKIPELLIVLDDYSDIVFKKFREAKSDINICVLEVYRRAQYDFESYRFGGDYPYELTLSSKLKYEDEQHFRILKTEIVKDIPDIEFDIYHNMRPLKAIIIKGTKNKFFLKIPDHQFPTDIYLQIGINVDNKIIIQRI